MDTAKDARILVLEDALRLLNGVISNRKLRFHIEYAKLGEALKKAGVLFYEVKYSYLDARSVAKLEATQNLVSSIDDFGHIFQAAIETQGYVASSSSERETVAQVSYALRTAGGFQKKLTEHDGEPGYAVDLLAVEITRTEPVVDSTLLQECRCTDGSRIWNIVTNLEGVRPGMKLVCAVLPPADLMGAVSEAMFLGKDPLPEDTPLGELTNVSKDALDQARAQVMQITKRMT
jgi:predicted RNA-binding protein with EMAP domain